MGLRKEGYADFKLQVVLEYLMPGADSIITSGTDSIIAGSKVKGIETVRVPMLAGGTTTIKDNNARIAQAVDQIDGPFRLYLRGHGEWQSMTLGGRAVREVVRDVQSLLTNPSVRENCQVISITGCQLALSKKSNGSGTSTNSFAKMFHKLIGASEEMKRVPVFARTVTVSVVTAEIAAITSTTKERSHLVEGTKMTGDISDNFKKAGTKLVYYWVGDRQMMTDAKNAGSVVIGLAEFEDFGAEA